MAFPWHSIRLLAVLAGQRGHSGWIGLIGRQADRGTLLREVEAVFGGTHAQLEEYLFDVQRMVAIDFRRAFEAGCKCRATPGRAVLCREVAPESCEL